MMDRIARIKEDLILMVEEQISHGVRNIDTHELGEVVDMIKDLCEACYYCEKAKETELGLNDMDYDNYDNYNRGRREGRMYYNGNGNSGNTSGGNTTSYNRDVRGGGMYPRGGRRGYDDHGMDPKEVEHYIDDLSNELIEMMRDIAPEDKAMFQQKLSSLANKIK